MPAIVNLQEKIGKTVGDRQPSDDPFEALARLKKLAGAMAHRTPYPKGVFRFKTHEEAHQWKWNHMLAAVREKAHASRNKPT